MLERLVERARRAAERRVAERIGALAERLEAELPGGISARAEAEGVRLIGRGLVRRIALDAALRRLLGSVR